MAGIWWDRAGSFKILHDINPLRLKYIEQRAGLFEKQVLDVGCGGGILSEAMAKTGAQVTGIDMAAPALGAARMHMELEGLDITYLQTTVEDMASKQSQCFDIITCMELVEHVPDPQSIVAACGRLIKPGGHIFFGTVNRTWMAYLFVIVLAEQVFRLIYKGTHTYNKFVKPSEMENWGRQSGMTPQNISGLRYIPFIRFCSLTKDTRMNYLMHFQKL